MYILLFLILFSTNSFASQNVNINTGFGYLTDNSGNIIGRYSDVNKGQLTIPDGYSYTEVPDQNTLNGITIYQSPDQQQQKLNDQALQIVISKEISNNPILQPQATAIQSNLSKVNQVK